MKISKSDLVLLIESFLNEKKEKTYKLKGGSRKFTFRRDRDAKYGWSYTYGKGREYKPTNQAIAAKLNEKYGPEYKYVLGSRGKYNNFSGTKLLAKLGGEIKFTYLIPDDGNIESIQKRIPGQKFKIITDKKEINKVVREYEKLSETELDRFSRPMTKSSEWASKKYMDLAIKYPANLETVKKTLGRVRPADVDGIPFIEYCVNYWDKVYSKNKTGHGTGLGFDMVPNSPSRAAGYKKFNKVINLMNDYSNGKFSVFDETFKKPVSWNASTSPGMTASSNLHYHFDIRSNFKLNAEGEKIVKELGTIKSAKTRKNLSTLKPPGVDAGKLFVALCAKEGVGTTCTSGSRNAYSQTRIVLQVAAGKERLGEADSWAVTNYGNFGKKMLKALRKSTIVL